MGTVALLSLTAALNPTLVAASTVMMVLPNPVTLMIGYLLGALMTSVTLGIIIVTSLTGTSTTSTTQNTLSPAADIALGALALVLAVVVSTEAKRRAVRRESKKERVRKEPRWRRAMSRGSARTTFLIGALLTLPGASYIAGLDEIHKQHLSTAEEVLSVLGFNIVMLALLELPLASFVVAPTWTPNAVERAKAAVSRRGRSLVVRALEVIGLLLIAKGAVGLIA